MFATFDDVTFDADSSRVDGFQMPQSMRIQEWRDRKEDAQFRALCQRLRQRKNAAAWYARHRDDPGFREMVLEHSRRMRRRHGQRRNAADRERRRKAAEDRPIVNVCEECGVAFVLPFGFHRKRRSKYCSRTCRNRVAYRARLERSRSVSVTG